MARIRCVLKHKKDIDGNLVLENKKPVFEEVMVPYTKEEEDQADAKQQAFLDRKSQKAQKLIDKEALRIKMGLTLEEMDLLKS